MFEIADNLLRFLFGIMLWAVGVLGVGLAIYWYIRTQSAVQSVGILVGTILLIVYLRSIF